ncbi:hypothetical protein F183_A51830 [Bryobacterales bacterium F-183]|nr:hypothetical protein F183_A51830 [Bryobacterales bacterium F-183]
MYAGTMGDPVKWGLQLVGKVEHPGRNPFNIHRQIEWFCVMPLSVRFYCIEPFVRLGKSSRVPARQHNTRAKCAKQ